MSGGHFDYQQYKIGQIADQVDQLIRSNDDKTLTEWGDTKGRNYSEKTIDAFRRGLRMLEIAQIYAQRIDWLVSGDDSEETFHRRLIEDIDQLDEKMSKQN